MKTATHILTHSTQDGVEARLYKLSEPWPVNYDDTWTSEFTPNPCNFVVVSQAVHGTHGVLINETFVFPHDGRESWEPCDYEELAGSTSPAIPHDTLLEGMGYTPIYRPGTHLPYE